MATTNPINNTVGSSDSGLTNTLTVQNNSNTASSQAKVSLVVGGGTAGDAYVQYTVTGATDYVEGIDNSDSDKFKISSGTSLGTNDTVVITGTTGGQYKGYNSNTAPPAGFIGEVLSGSRTTALALVAATITEITTVTLTPGNWEVSGVAGFNATGANTGNLLWQGILSATSASAVPIDTPGGNVSLGNNIFGGTGVAPILGLNSLTFNLGPCRVSIASNTTYYLNTQGNGSTGFNAESYGIIRAVRIG